MTIKVIFLNHGRVPEGCLMFQWFAKETSNKRVTPNSIRQPIRNGLQAEKKLRRLEPGNAQTRSSSHNHRA
jgi:hypothetical protein